MGFQASFGREQGELTADNLGKVRCFRRPMPVLKVITEQSKLSGLAVPPTLETRANWKLGTSSFVSEGVQPWGCARTYGADVCTPRSPRTPPRLSGLWAPRLPCTEGLPTRSRIFSAALRTNT